MQALPTPLVDNRYLLRKATASDVESIVSLLVEDTRRAAIETIAPESRDAYLQGFRRVDADAAQLLVVATDDAEGVVAIMQLSFIPGLSRAGSTRLQIEAVRVRSDHRSNGLGGAMMHWAIAEGKRRNVGLVQLTSDSSRTDAHRFYDRLGFVASHVGYKLDLGLNS
ncbi:GNAT family N-acetyltransferase [Homoserinimonas sp. A520]